MVAAGTGQQEGIQKHFESAEIRVRKAEELNLVMHLKANKTAFYGYIRSKTEILGNIFSDKSSGKGQDTG